MAAIIPTVRGILERVARVLKDPDYTDPILASIGNNVLMRIAGGEKVIEKNGMFWTTPPLPGLFKIGTVSTLTDPVGGYAVAMPADYQRALVRVFNGDGARVKICTRWDDFIRGNGILSQSGAVNKCYLKGRQLYFQGIPATADTLSLQYSRFPIAMALAVDADPDASPTVDEVAEVLPDGIPIDIMEGLMVAGMCAQAYGEIEDGIEGKKVNTDYWTNQYQLKLRELASLIPAEGEDFKL